MQTSFSVHFFQILNAIGSMFYERVSIKKGFTAEIRNISWTTFLALFGWYCRVPRV